MTMLRTVLLALMMAVGAVAGCDRSTPASAPPTPLEVTAEATGHYCGMLLAEHEGPKGQIHLASRQQPIWFSSVRDAVAFTRLPEEARDIAAIYVNDMGKATRWEQPEAGTWIDARAAWFVIESDRRGGMGGPEAVPFSDHDAAQTFREAHGGRLVRLDEIPDAYVLGPIDVPRDAASHEAGPQPAAGGPAGQTGQAQGHAGHGSH